MIKPKSIDLPFNIPTFRVQHLISGNAFYDIEQIFAVTLFTSRAHD